MSGVVGVDDACGSGVVGVVVTRSLLALLAECSHCRWTTVEYDPHWRMSRPACALQDELLQRTCTKFLVPPVHCRTSCLLDELLQRTCTKLIMS